MKPEEIKAVQNKIPGVFEKIYGYRASSLWEIGGYQNRVFEFSYGQDPLILRVTPSRHRNREQLQAEITVVNRLKEEGIPVAASITLPGTNSIEEVHLEGQTYYLCVFEKAPGKTWIEEPQNEDTFFEAGKVLARIHKKNKELPDGLSRPSWKENHYLQNAFRCIPAEKSWVVKKMEKHLAKMESFPRGECQFGLVHGDYNFANMLYEDKRVTVIDFDESEFHWFVYDLAVYLFYYLLGGDPANMDLEANRLVWKKFGEGYCQEKELDPEMVERLPEFLRLREFILYSSLHGHFNRGRWGKWQKDFISTAEARIREDRPFADMDFNRLLGF